MDEMREILAYKKNLLDAIPYVRKDVKSNDWPDNYSCKKIMKCLNLDYHDYPMFEYMIYPAVEVFANLIADKCGFILAAKGCSPKDRKFIKDKIKDIIMSRNIFVNLAYHQIHAYVPDSKYTVQDLRLIWLDVLEKYVKNVR